ncbi:MAG: 7TM diverse intracellular signaling domain-containing protein [Ferruginibacter sp.]
MQRILISFYFFILSIGNCAAQDTLVLNGQPGWNTAKDIADNCLFFEETGNKALSFDEAKVQHFIPYVKKLREQKFSNRPLIIQWLKFTIQNTSDKDTVDLSISTVHYFTKLYNNNKLIGVSGAYEVNPNDQNDITSEFDKERLPIIIPPNTSINYWFRTEDRQNQLIPPQILLETKVSAMTENLKSGFTARYLFLILAGMTGCFLFIGIFAAYNYYLYRHVSFIWYICYTIAAFFSGLHWMDIRLGLKMFSPLVHDIIFSVFIYLIPVLYSFFIGSMLQLNVHFKKGWLVVKLLVMVCILQMVLQLLEVRFGWFPFNINYYGIILTPFAIILLNIYLLILTVKSKDPVKWFLFTGIVSLLVLWCMPLLNLYSPTTAMKPELFLIINFPISFLLLGLTIEAICFSFALTYRSKLVLLEKN